ncbi:ABC transporter substrate-binding protein [Paenibacillus sp. Soil766]|uniref:ABC transporter substrate-binding protein n=1 Tax=Paenibacillus sp. Soil766 TaxID=1736404 RepID=UPI00070DB881|nr:ABC transporter substrate-binding protein [Paenibacillus sp. Soil766]KRE97903.1 ABC transporter substrate-binding protein [Paenibacillus sp. Soil766]
MKKLKLVTMGTLLALSLSACSSSNSADPAASKTPSSPSGTTAAKEELKPATFSYFLFNAGKNMNTNETPIGKELEKQTGVNFKVENLVGESKTKSGVMIAGNEFPDVVQPEGEIDKFMDAGAFIPLDDLIAKYGPNIKRVYGPYFDKMKQKDGKIYHLPFSANQGFAPNPNVDQGAFWIQRGVLKELGYPKLTTLDEYFNAIKTYKDKHPQVDGKDTIGFSVMTYDTNFFTITNPAFHLAGYPNDGGLLIDLKTNEAKSNAIDEATTKRWVKKLNEVNTAGLFDKESFTMNKDQYLAKLTSGRVLGYFAYDWQVGDARNNLAKAGVDDKRYVALPIVFDKGVKDQYLDPPSFVNNRGISISKSAKDPVRIIKFFDTMLTEDNQILQQWGIKGQTYEVDDKGKFFRTDEEIAKIKDPKFYEDFGLKMFAYNWPRYGNFSIVKGDNAFDPNKQPAVAEKNYTDGDRALLKAYNAKVFTDMFSKPDARPWYPAWSINKGQGTPEQIFEQKMGDLQKKAYPEMILASGTDKFEKAWSDYVAQASKLDIKGYEAFITKVVKDRVAGNWAK